MINDCRGVFNLCKLMGTRHCMHENIQGEDSGFNETYLLARQSKTKQYRMIDATNESSSHPSLNRYMPYFCRVFSIAMA